MPRLGIIGTMVWDRIYSRDGRAQPVEEWGGISYALAAASAARPAGWSLVPMIKVGRDLEEEAHRFLRSLPGLDLDNIRVVPEPNNRVELRYHDRDRRAERLTGGVTAWTWPELEPIVRDLDALYINFISGFELDLVTAQQLRMRFDGPIYADLHSIFLGIDATGLRTPHPLDAWREWLRCFDFVQVNEDELGLLAHAWGDPWRFAADVVGEGLRVLFVTMGPRGAAYVAWGGTTDDPLRLRSDALIVRQPLIVPRAVTSEHIPPASGVRDGDTTGCGDVFGATCFLRMLAGANLAESVRSANVAAARNVEHRGASGLDLHLRGRIAS
jgi:sugar/nucleoside kinase (ribokinase family)